MHGVEGIDALDGADAVPTIAARLPRFGVTAFCPTIDGLRIRRRCGRCWPASRDARRSSAPGRARVLPAHLESNFINPRLRGAQPLECLRVARAPRLGETAIGEFHRRRHPRRDRSRARRTSASSRSRRSSTGGLDLIRRLRRRRPSRLARALGRDLRQGQRRHRRRRPPRDASVQPHAAAGHREPGLAGAVLASDEVAAELICDGVSRPSGGDARGDCREGPGARHGDHRRHRRLRPAGRLARHARRAARSRSATPRTWTMARSPAAC